MLLGEIRVFLTSNISAGEQVTMKKFHVVKFTIEFYTILEFAPPVVHRSAARGPKMKTFPPKFLENGKADRHNSGTVRYILSPGRINWNMPLLLFRE